MLGFNLRCCCFKFGNQQLQYFITNINVLVSLVFSRSIGSWNEMIGTKSARLVPDDQWI